MPGSTSSLVLGAPALAFLSGAVIVYEPSWFYPILIVDLWVLGYHHVIATFTRLCFDRASYEERRWMILYLVPAVAAATVLLAWLVGIWAVVTVYFYWAVVPLHAAELGDFAGPIAGPIRKASYEDGWTGPGDLLRGADSRHPAQVERGPYELYRP